MARYFLHLHECGTITRDEEGVEKQDLDAVRSQAIEAARGLMCAEVAEGRLCLSCSIQIVDAGGETVMSVPFHEALLVTGLGAGF